MRSICPHGVGVHPYGVAVLPHLGAPQTPYYGDFREAPSCGHDQLLTPPHGEELGGGTGLGARLLPVAWWF